MSARGVVAMAVAQPRPGCKCMGPATHGAPDHETAAFQHSSVGGSGPGRSRRHPLAVQAHHDLRDGIPVLLFSKSQVLGHAPLSRLTSGPRTGMVLAQSHYPDKEVTKSLVRFLGCTNGISHSAQCVRRVRAEAALVLTRCVQSMVGFRVAR